MCAGGQRKSRAAPRERRQAAAAVEHEDEDGGPQFNPENPYQVSRTRSLRGVYIRPERPELSVRIRRALPEKAFPPMESFSHLREPQQMLGSRRRGPARHCTSFSVCVFSARLSKAFLFRNEAVWIISSPPTRCISSPYLCRGFWVYPKIVLKSSSAIQHVFTWVKVQSSHPRKYSRVKRRILLKKRSLLCSNWSKHESFKYLKITSDGAKICYVEILVF